MEVKEVLAERGKRYGSFDEHARISQQLKEIVLGDPTYNEETLLFEDKYTPAQAEALEMICHKLARIVNGDPDYKDTWVDIAGYATLVANNLKD